METKYPKELEKIYEEALDAFESGNYTKAKIKFEEAIKYHEKNEIPYNIDALKILSHIYLLLNENTKAKLLISKLIKETGDDPVQSFKMAIAFAQSGDLLTSKNILEDTLKKIKEKKETDKNTLASLYNLLGNLNFELGDLSEAKKCFEKALENKPESETIKQNLKFVKNLLEGNSSQKSESEN
ncbi:MAG TPA: tetratricopeptide repeat protein [Aquificae bacterium]|nr:tetratricopeptide repeat protein [Aquificota bacterium]